jgi:hypothetical protein
MKQKVVRTVLIVVALALFAAAPAWSSSIDFLASGNGGSWSFSGSGSLSLTANFVQVTVVGSGIITPITDGTETFTTGAFLGGVGTTVDPYQWGPGGTYDITGCVPPGAPGCTSVNLFNGDFEGATLFFNATKGMAFVGLDVAGNVNPALAAFLGVSGGGYAGISNFNVLGKVPLGGHVASGDLVLTPSVPEPASLVFLGIGLVALAGVTRLRKHQTQG